MDAFSFYPKYNIHKGIGLFTQNIISIKGLDFMLISIRRAAPSGSLLGAVCCLTDPGPFIPAKRFIQSTISTSTPAAKLSLNGHYLM